MDHGSGKLDAWAHRGGFLLKLAKEHIDVAVMTDRLDEMLSFWQGPAGLTFEELLPTGGGNHQHRHAVNGSVFKLNHPRKGLPEVSPSGYRGMWIARDDIDARRALVDPDGNRLILVPRGELGIEGIAVTVAVRDPEAHARFYRDALQLEEVGEGRFRCGDSIFVLERDPTATRDVSIHGRGFRYLTIQVFDCRAEHARILAAGGIEGVEPRQHGEIALFSMVRDPDGNWVEISQRASLTGPLPGR
jgi:catechol 2,3-dioxygenase-like lactoylglutathione lyase family enzyme